MSGSCEICGALGAHGHHILEKSVYPEYREEPMNLVTLCNWHHTMSGECSPHGDGKMAKINFNCWLRDNRPGKFKWAMEHSRRPLATEATDR